MLQPLTELMKGLRSVANGPFSLLVSPCSSTPIAAAPVIPRVLEQRETDDGWAPFRAVGTRLANQSSDFDPRNFGFRKLSDLARKINYFEVTRRTVCAHTVQACREETHGASRTKKEGLTSEHVSFSANSKRLGAARSRH